jgi:ankyrin repeat protein
MDRQRVAQIQKESKTAKIARMPMQLLEAGKRKARRIFLLPKRRRALDTALRKAADGGDNSKITRLIKAGASILSKDHDGWNALHHAAGQGHAEACALLVKKHSEAGGDVKKLIEAKSKYGWNALHRAASLGSAEACGTLVKQYAEAGGGTMALIETENNGLAALHCAAISGNMEACVTLLKAYTDAKGDAKKHCTAESRHYEYEDMTARDIAKSKKAESAAAFLAYMESGGFIIDFMEPKEFAPFFSSFWPCVGH